MTFIIYGVGAIGGTLAAKLADAGEAVTGIARGAQLDALKSRRTAAAHAPGRNPRQLPAASPIRPRSTSRRTT